MIRGGDTSDYHPATLRPPGPTMMATRAEERQLHARRDEAEENSRISTLAKFIRTLVHETLTKYQFDDDEDFDDTSTSAYDVYDFEFDEEIIRIVQDNAKSIPKLLAMSSAYSCSTRESRWANSSGSISSSSEDKIYNVASIIENLPKAPSRRTSISPCRERSSISSPQQRLRRSPQIPSPYRPLEHHSPQQRRRYKYCDDDYRLKLEGEGGGGGGMNEEYDKAPMKPGKKIIQGTNLSGDTEQTRYKLEEPAYVGNTLGKMLLLNRMKRKGSDSKNERQNNNDDDDYDSDDNSIDISALKLGDDEDEEEDDNEGSLDIFDLQQANNFGRRRARNHYKDTDNGETSPSRNINKVHTERLSSLNQGKPVQRDTLRAPQRMPSFNSCSSSGS